MSVSRTFERTEPHYSKLRLTNHITVRATDGVRRLANLTYEFEITEQLTAAGRRTQSNLLYNVGLLCRGTPPFSLSKCLL
jgi:hypothetical protein